MILLKKNMFEPGNVQAQVAPVDSLTVTDPIKHFGSTQPFLFVHFCAYLTIKFACL